MKSILLKLDDELFRETEERVKELKMSRNSYIKKAVHLFNKRLKAKSMQDQLTKEALMLKINNPDKALIEEFQNASIEDLQKYLDD